MLADAGFASGAAVAKLEAKKIEPLVAIAKTQAHWPYDFRPPSQPKPERRIRILLPSAETAAMPFWALLASGQIMMRKVDGWQTLAEKPAAAVPLDLAA